MRKGVPGWLNWFSIDSWFWLRSWSQGCEIKFPVRLCAQREACLRFSLSPSALLTTHALTLCLSLSVSQISKSLKKKNLEKKNLVRRQSLIRESPDGFKIEKLGKLLWGSGTWAEIQKRARGKEGNGGKSILDRKSCMCKGPVVGRVGVGWG